MYIFPKELNCYVCHNKCLGIYCSNCLRCYCKKCASKNEVIDTCSSAMFIKKCSQCVQLQSSLEKWENFAVIRPVRREFINNVLIKILGWCGKIPRLLIKSDSFFEKRIDPAHEPFSFRHIRQKMKNLLYRCSEELVMDLKVIQHILLTSPKNSFDTKELREGSKYLDLVIKELGFVDECPSCVLNHVKMFQPSLWNDEKKHSNFSYPCPWPHALVLARVRGYSLWPAKVLHYNSKRKIVHVLFFGTYERGFVNLKSIFHARDPEKYPEDYGRIRKQINSKIVQYDIAIKELKNYIECLKLGFPDKVELSKEFKKPWLPKDTIYQFDYNVFNPPKNHEQMMQEEEAAGCSSFHNQCHHDYDPNLNIPTMSSDLRENIADDGNSSCYELEEKNENGENIDTSYQNDKSDTLSVGSLDSNFDERLGDEMSLVDSLMDVSISSSRGNSPLLGSEEEDFQVADEPTEEYQFPEYLEDEICDCNDIALSGEADSNENSESEWGSVSNPNISVEDLERRALDDGLWKNLRVGLERYEDSGGRSATTGRKGTVGPLLMSSSESLSDSSIEITAEISEDLLGETPVRANSDSSIASSKGPNRGRFSIEFSDIDDDESMSDVFPCIDHRIIDESEDEID